MCFPLFGMQVMAMIIDSARGGGMLGMVLFDVILATVGMLTFEHVVVE